MTRSVFTEQWRGVDGIYGGYVVGRVIEEARIIRGFVPLSANIQFTGTVRGQETSWEVSTVHHGRSSALVRVGLVQGHQKVVALVRLGTDPGTTAARVTLDTGHLPAPAQVPPFSFRWARLEYERFFEQRLLPAGEGEPRTRTRAWIRMDESGGGAPELSAYGVMGVLLDAQPPGLFFEEEAPAFVPTMDFTVHFTHAPADGRDEWRLVEQETVWATREYCVEESMVYDAAGVLLAQARQTRRVVWSA